IARADERGEPVLLGAAAGAPDEGARGGRARGGRARGQIHAHGLGNGRVTQARLGTALIGHLQRQLEGTAARPQHRHGGAELVVVDLLPAEVLVGLDLALMHLRRPELRSRVRRHDLYSWAVELLPTAVSYC